MIIRIYFSCAYEPNPASTRRDQYSPPFSPNLQAGACHATDAFVPSSNSLSTRSGLSISLLKASPCSSSRCRSVGPGYVRYLT